MKKKVLLVDDDRITNIINKKVFQRYEPECNPLIFTSGFSLLDYLQRHGEDRQRYIILIDINMPGMNGWQLLQELTNGFQQEKFEAHILSSSINPVDREMAENFSAVQSFIVKPLSFSDVKRVLT